MRDEENLFVNKMLFQKRTNRMINIVFLIRSLNIGGAERQLVELAKGLSKTNFKITICLFYNEGVLLKELHSIRNVKIITLDKSGRWDIFRFFFRLIRILKSLNPQILYSFLPEANIAGLIAGKISGVPRIVWGVRASNMDVSRYDWLAGISLWLSALMSRFPNAIIVNSHVGKEFHRSIGYNTNRMMVTQNGIGTDRFKPDHSAGLMVRGEWGIEEKTITIGLVGRIDPMKDHATFLRAVKIFNQEERSVRFVCIGDGKEPYKNEIHSLCRTLGLNGSLIWAGERYDMTAVYNAIDIITSSSFGEGFPNVIGEAMACGIPCVVTDVGDSALIVGETGIVVPPKDPKALADGWRSMLKHLNNKSYSIKEMARTRIVSHYNSEIFVQKTSKMFLGLLQKD